jgi:hypothetical protein
VSPKSSGGAWPWLVVAVAVVALSKPAAEAINPSGGAASGSSAHGIPADYYALYQSAPKCKGLDWASLAAIGYVETNHGQSKLPGVHSGANFAGAKGPMQFLQPTWDGVRKRHPDVGPSIYDPRNAIPAAAHKLCDDGASTGQLQKAIFSYNHSSEYVNDVLGKAKEYRS